MTLKKSFLGVMDQLANNSALMFHTPMEKLFLVKAASARGFQLRNVSHNQNAKLLLYHNVYNAILGGKMKGLHLVQRIHVERTFQVMVSRIITPSSKKLNIEA